jgi:hypothetical protein
MVRNLPDTFLTERDPGRPAKDLTRGINKSDLNVPSKEVTPFSSDFKHAHVTGQFASFTFGYCGMKPNIWSPGSENRSEPSMLLSARAALPPDPALDAH